MEIQQGEGIGKANVAVSLQLFIRVNNCHGAAIFVTSGFVISTWVWVWVGGCVMSQLQKVTK